jgi:Flp pilus assembly protein TadD
LRYGMCLDWTGRQNESEPYIQKAVQLDPNGSFTAANVGWHQVQLKNYAAAKVWLERSIRLEWHDNTIAESYLSIVNARLAEAATNSVSADSPLLIE